MLLRIYREKDAKPVMEVVSCKEPQRTAKHSVRGTRLLSTAAVAAGHTRGDT